MWGWLESSQSVYSKAFFYPIVTIALLMAAFWLAFNGLTFVKIRSANVIVGGWEVELQGCRARAYGWALVALGALCLLLALTLVF